MGNTSTAELLLPALLVFIWPVLGITTLVLGLRLASRYVRAVERRGETTAEYRQLIERVNDLENALDEARSEIARLDAAQTFTTRLLSERAGQAV